ncbi:MAG: glycoside hydrolase family 3 protein [Phycisphaerales bacterium]|nr:glycoside hydrolase family 3 protein [Phycisphaerales bacterium]
MSRARELERLAGRMVMVGVRGASPDDPLFRADLAAIRDAHGRAVVLFDVDLPTLTALRENNPGASAADAPRNILSPAQLLALCGHLREALGPGAIIAVDQEGGRVARLNPRRGFPEFPSAAAYADMADAKRADAAHHLAETLAGAGVNLNFAPCVDVALNPRSPIIAGKERAFSADPRRVAHCAAEVIAAHDECAVRTCVKHFPGHGSAGADSHLGLPDVSRVYDEGAETAPFASLIARFRRETPSPDASLRAPAWPFAVMTGHLLHRRTDPDHPASLSPAHTEGALRRALGFEGVVVTDSLDMRAITDRYSPAEAATRAAGAGADLILDALNSPGPARDNPAPLLTEALARAAFDKRLGLSPRRLQESNNRLNRLFPASHAPI